MEENLSVRDFEEAVVAYFAAAFHSSVYLNHNSFGDNPEGKTGTVTTQPRVPTNGQT
jgi:hypothetical protein